MASKKNKSSVSATTVVKYLALLGNAFYILWISIKGINQGFDWDAVHVMTYVLLLFLLSINIYLIISKE